MVQVGLIDEDQSKRQPGPDFFECSPVRSSLLTVIEGPLEIFSNLWGDGKHLLHHLDMVADSFRLGFQQRQAEIDTGLGILWVEFHREACRSQRFLWLFAQELKPSQACPAGGLLRG